MHKSAVYKQSGQALVLAIIMIGVILTAFVFFFRTGKVAASRLNQTHILDTAVYSGALVQARALNTISYINRAHIGHQVAMAHLVTLGSWAQFSYNESNQLASGNPPAYLLSMMFGNEHGQAYMSAAKAAGLAGVASTSGDLASAFRMHNNLIDTVFQHAQKSILNSVPSVRKSIIDSVIKQNYENNKNVFGDATKFGLEIIDDTWDGFVKQVNAQGLKSSIQHSVSLYRFLDPRDHTTTNPWVVDARCPHKRHELRRRGSTQIDSTGRWASSDTQSFHALRSNRWIGCYYREYAMGWGYIPTSSMHNIGTEYIDNPPENFSSQDFWRWVKESTNWNIHSGNSNPLSSSKAVSQRQVWSGGGLQPFFDVTDPKLFSTKFALRLKRISPENILVSTVSAAETVFAIPIISKNKSERASLFRPYWQARLSSSEVYRDQEH